MKNARAADGAAVRHSAAEFPWDPFTIAVLRHSTLPWSEDAPASVAGQTVALDVFDGGERERLSLLGQFAAHVAFLPSAEVAAGPFDPSEWQVVRRRGADVRLLRRSAARCFDAPDAFETIQAFADALHVTTLETLQRSWCRPDLVYAEVFSLLARKSADLTWLRASGSGAVLAPGAETLRHLWTERDGVHGTSDPSIADALRLASELDDSSTFVRVAAGSSLTPFSALRMLGGGAAFRSAAEAAEALVPVLSEKHHVLLLPGDEEMDGASRQALQLAMRMAPATWLGRDRGTALPRTTIFAIAPTLDARSRFARRADAERDPRRWAHDFTMSEPFGRFLHDGSVPRVSGTLDGVAEPKRSYIGALSLVGKSIARTAAESFLQHFFYDSPLEELEVDGVVAVDAQGVEFQSDEAWLGARTAIPEASLPALCRIAAGEVQGLAAARLLITAGDYQQAMHIIEAHDALEPATAIELLQLVPREALSPTVARRYADALLAEGRYADARSLATQLSHDDAEFVIAYAERRSGRTDEALARIEALQSQDSDAVLLRAELLRLHGRTSDAASLLDAQDADERFAYERELARIDGGQPPVETLPPGYYAERLATYAAHLRGDHAEAAEHASKALILATCTVERIDATIDRLFELFSAGRWQETRALANEALVLVDEAQGDRAAAWILYLLAFLAADDGQWEHSERQLRRLRTYHESRNDRRSLLELELVSAQLAFSRTNFDEAAQRAHAVWRNESFVPQLREAAALILDETDWIRQRFRPLRSTGHSGNAELDARHRFLAERLRQRDDVTDELCAAAATRSDKLKALRSALACGRRDLATELGEQLGVTIAFDAIQEHEHVRVLRALALHQFPYAPADIGVDWRFVSRNRFGKWLQEGSLPPLDATELESIGASSEWIRCSDSELLFLSGSDHWPQSSRDAAASIVRLQAENRRMRRILEQESDEPRGSVSASDHGMIGESPAICAVFERVERIAKRDVVVLILGESGTGKELVANAVHRSSARRQKPFMAINCAALPENLIESELFGHARGAFTSADRDRAGLIETADGGTLFLDEVGELPLAAQAKLLRFLQEGEFRRVGETTNRKADVRIVCATHRRLDEEVEKGRFREDLYYRLHGVDISLPPLRERGRDILLLADHFLAAEVRRNGGGPSRLSDDVAALFAAYRWPGNVRELQNAIRGAHAVAGDARELKVEHLPANLARAEERRSLTGSYQDAVVRFRRDLIERSLAEAGGNQNRAAALLQMSRQALAYQIRELGIVVRKERAGAGRDRIQSL